MSETSEALLAHVSEEENSEYMGITGKYTLTRVYLFNEKPVICRLYQKYAHTKKLRIAQKQTCGLCAEYYPTEVCSNTDSPAKCEHYNPSHKATTSHV